MPNLIEKANEVLKVMEKDWNGWCDRARMSDELRNTQTFTFEVRRNFIKFIQGRDNGQRSVNGFLVLNPPKGTDNKTNQPFQVGDLLMAKSWDQPTKNFARGNVFKDGWENNIRWTGVL